MDTRKGFTLVEMLVVIGLLAIFGVAIGISLTRNMKQNKQNQEKEFVQKVIGAANLYASNNEDIITSLYEDKGYAIIKVKDLIDAGLIQDNLLDPSTNEKVTGSEAVKIELDTSGTIKIEFPVTNPNDDYLQTGTIKIEYGSSQDELCYKGLDTESLRYVEASGKAKTGYFRKNENIRCDTSTVDVSKLGTYEVKYDYQIQNGVWKQTTRKIMLVDTTPPTCGASVGNTTWINGTTSASVGCIDNYKCSNSIFNHSFINAKTAKIVITDISNNKTECTVNAYSDMLSPTNVTISKNPNVEWTSQNTVLTGTGKDDLSGIKYYQFSQNGNLTNISTSGTAITVASSTSQTFTISAEGEYTYYFYVQDVVNNIAKSNGISVKIDRTKPTIESLTLTNSSSAENITFRLKDGQSGVAQYCISTTNSSNGCSWISYAGTNKYDTGNITIANPHKGENIYLFAKDVAGYISDPKSLNTSCVEVTYGADITTDCNGTCGKTGKYKRNAYDKYITSTACPSKDAYNGSTCTAETVTHVNAGDWSCCDCQCGESCNEYRNVTTKVVDSFGNVCSTTTKRESREHRKRCDGDNIIEGHGWCNSPAGESNCCDVLPTYEHGGCDAGMSPYGAAWCVKCYC